MVHKRSEIGACSYYYGTAHPHHLTPMRALLHEGVPVFEIHGCAYPEMALAEMAREALEAEAKCAVFIANDMTFDPKDVRRIGEQAISNNAIVTASAARNRKGDGVLYFAEEEQIHLGSSWWCPGDMSDMGFTAIPLTVLQKLAESETREYTNSSVITSVMTGKKSLSRPFFSPWQRKEGTLQTPSISPGIYSTPERAFMLRAQAAGFPIIRSKAQVKSLTSGGYFFRVMPGDSKKRAENYIFRNYAICIPCWGQVDLEQQKALWELEKAGVCIIEMHGCPYIDLARSELVRQAQALDCDGVFFLDHDIMFIPIDVIKLIREAEARWDVVSGIYCMRKTAHALIGAPDVPQDSKIGFFELGDVYPALYTGLGFSAIPMSVFESLDHSLPKLEAGFAGKVRPYFALDVNHDFYCGEDASFCGRVQGLTIKTISVDPAQSNLPGASAVGHTWDLKRAEVSPTKHRVWIDTRPRIFHKGSYHYGIEDHSIAVPRYANLEAVHCATREGMLSFFKSAEDFPAHVRARTQGLDDGAEAGHGTLAEESAP